MNDALVVLNLWYSAGDEPGLAWIADVRGCDPWLGRSKKAATTRLSVSLPERLFVCDYECVHVCVRENRLILLPRFNVSKNVCARVCVCVKEGERENKCARLLVNTSFNHSYCVTKDVPCSYNQTRFLNKVLVWDTSKLQQESGLKDVWISFRK